MTKCSALPEHCRLIDDVRLDRGVDEIPQFRFHPGQADPAHNNGWRSRPRISTHEIQAFVAADDRGGIRRIMTITRAQIPAASHSDETSASGSFMIDACVVNRESRNRARLVPVTSNDILEAFRCPKAAPNVSCVFSSSIRRIGGSNSAALSSVTYTNHSPNRILHTRDGRCDKSGLNGSISNIIPGHRCSTSPTHVVPDRGDPVTRMSGRRGPVRNYLHRPWDYWMPQRYRVGIVSKSV